MLQISRSVSLYLSLFSSPPPPPPRDRWMTHTSSKNLQITTWVEVPPAQQFPVWQEGVIAASNPAAGDERWPVQTGHQLTGWWVYSREWRLPARRNASATTGFASLQRKRWMNQTWLAPFIIRLLGRCQPSLCSNCYSRHVSDLSFSLFFFSPPSFSLSHTHIHSPIPISQSWWFRIPCRTYQPLSGSSFTFTASTM
jgi:hypothetical protein